MRSIIETALAVALFFAALHFFPRANHWFYGIYVEGNVRTTVQEMVKPEAQFKTLNRPTGRAEG